MIAALAWWVPVAIWLPAGLATIAGELLGVFDSKRGDSNTISEWVWKLRRVTRGASIPFVLAFLGWLAYHFTFQS